MVELAKRYSDEGAPKLLNGVLHAIFQEEQAQCIFKNEVLNAPFFFIFLEWMKEFNLCWRGFLSDWQDQRKFDQVYFCFLYLQGLDLKLLLKALQ